MAVAESVREANRMKANQIRLAMTDTKREIRRGGRELAIRHLEDPSEIVARMRVEVFLRSVPKIGKGTVPKLIQRAQLPAVSANWRVGPLYEDWSECPENRTLTTRQRLALVDVLRGRDG